MFWIAVPTMTMIGARLEPIDSTSPITVLRKPSLVAMRYTKPAASAATIPVTRPTGLTRAPSTEPIPLTPPPALANVPTRPLSLPPRLTNEVATPDKMPVMEPNGFKNVDIFGPRIMNAAANVEANPVASALAPKNVSAMNANASAILPFMASITGTTVSLILVIAETNESNVGTFPVNAVHSCDNLPVTASMTGDIAAWNSANFPLAESIAETIAG